MFSTTTFWNFVLGSVTMLGQAPGKTGDRTNLESQALGVASNVAVSALQDALSSVLPIDVDLLRIEPTENAGNSYLVGKWITDSWFVTYRYHPGEHNVDILWIRRWGK